MTLNLNQFQNLPEVEMKLSVCFIYLWPGKEINLRNVFQIGIHFLWLHKEELPHFLFGIAVIFPVVLSFLAGSPWQLAPQEERVGQYPGTVNVCSWFLKYIFEWINFENERKSSIASGCVPDTETSLWKRGLNNKVRGRRNPRDSTSD